MPKFFRALAIDYDGTLTSQQTPSAEVLVALEETRREGHRLVLATGRTLGHLTSDFPAAKSLFDAIVAENGAVVWTHFGGTRLLAAPPDEQLEAALGRRGVPLRRGRVLVDTFAEYDKTVLEEIGRLGLEYQLVRNRSALMVMPTGISKGTGLFDALGDLAVSHHNTVGIGDAENDHSLLECCEIGVAVGNAIESLKAQADVVLTRSAGEAVLSFLRGPLLRGDIRLQPKRWQVELGTAEDGRKTLLPASQINLLITGGTLSGKSYFAGLFAERLIRLGYSLCVLDPEGDHTNLGLLRGVMTAGGAEPPPSSEQLNRLLLHRFGSVIVDLSLMASTQKVEYMRAALQGLHRLRAQTGLPHWILLDEAHMPIGYAGIAASALDLSDKGYCLVTYRPGELPQQALQQMDAVVVFSKAALEALAPIFSTASGDESAVRELNHLPGESAPRKAVLIRVVPRGGAQRFIVDERFTPHVRHLHKYAEAQLPFERRFFFRRGAEDTGRSAGNLSELDAMLGNQDLDVIRHHSLHGDFSRWIRDVLRDIELADAIAGVERELARDASPDAVRSARMHILRAIEERYLARSTRERERVAPGPFAEDW